MPGRRSEYPYEQNKERGTLMNRRALLIFVVSICVVSGLQGVTYADNDPGTLKSELASDKAAIAAEKEEIKENSSDAKAEEKSLLEQIAQAVAAGDKAKAEELRQQLKALHAENVQQKKEDLSGLKEDRQELAEDAAVARHTHPNKDKDNNPPGLAGGAGTNWENPPGPAGGRGASPDRHHKY